MKIIYNENPLKTVVELDDRDKEVFWLKIKVEELVDRLVSVNCSLTRGDRGGEVDIQRAIDRSKLEDYIDEDDGEKTAVDKRADQMFAAYTRELQGEHNGDCVCQPCSCFKCRAEDILGVKTLDPFPGNHELRQISGAFGQGRTLVQAVEYLLGKKISKQKPDDWKNCTQEQYEGYVVGWEADIKRAAEWLEKYREEHFPVAA